MQRGTEDSITAVSYRNRLNRCGRSATCRVFLRSRMSAATRSGSRQQSSSPMSRSAIRRSVAARSRRRSMLLIAPQVTGFQEQLAGR